MTQLRLVSYPLIATSTMMLVLNSYAVLKNDEREEILLADDDISHLSNEMHGFLVTIQQVTEGIEKDNMNQVFHAAKASGLSSIKNISGTLKSSLPTEFKKMGYATRKSFEQLAIDAEQFGDKEHTLSQLNQVLTLCTNCHSKYKVE